MRDEDEEIIEEEKIDEFASYFVQGLTPKGVCAYVRGAVDGCVIGGMWNDCDCI